MTEKIGCVQHDCDDCKNRIRQLSEVTARMRKLEAVLREIRSGEKGNAGMRINEMIDEVMKK